MNSEAAITSLAQVIITRYEKIKIERADFCQKSMKYHPGVACQRRSIYCIVRGRGAHCRKLRERKGGGGCENGKGPLMTDPTLHYVQYAGFRIVV